VTKKVVRGVFFITAFSCAASQGTVEIQAETTMNTTFYKETEHFHLYTSISIATACISSNSVLQLVNGTGSGFLAI
jgi:hypothetical protein